MCQAHPLARSGDAASILLDIFENHHLSFAALGEKYSRDNWDCTSNECLSHTIIGMNLLRTIKCYNCSFESRYYRFTSLLRGVDESLLRKFFLETSIHELLRSPHSEHVCFYLI